VEKSVERSEPRSLIEVREWKEARYREVANLPLQEAIRTRLRDASARAEDAGFPCTSDLAPLVAENRSTYRRRPR